jgi:hypothetical protein
VDGWKGWWGSWRIANKLLEEADMEDVVQPGALGEVEAHNNLIDELGDVVWPEEARLELPFLRLGQEGDRAMSEA